MGVQVNKAWGHCKAAGIDLRVANSIRKIAHGYNSILVDSNIPNVGLPAGTVQDLTIFYQDIEGLGGRTSQEEQG